LRLDEVLGHEATGRAGLTFVVRSAGSGAEQWNDCEPQAHGAAAHRRCSGAQVGQALDAITAVARPLASAAQTAFGSAIVPADWCHPSTGSEERGTRHDAVVQKPSAPGGSIAARFVAPPLDAVQVAASTAIGDPDARHLATSKQGGRACGSYAGGASADRSFARHSPARQL
jgi:hypothetical protein